jgi:hypothetical protein
MLCLLCESHCNTHSDYSDFPTLRTHRLIYRALKSNILGLLLLLLGQMRVNILTSQH